MYYHLSRKRNSAKNILYENVKIIGLFFFPSCKWWFVNDFTEKLFKNDIARWGGREEPIISEKVDNGGGGWRGRRLLLRPKLFEVRGSITPVSLSCDPIETLNLNLFSWKSFFLKDSFLACFVLFIRWKDIIFKHKEVFKTTEAIISYCNHFLSHLQGIHLST